MVAAITTSVPEATAPRATGITVSAGCATPISSIRAFNRLGITRTMEEYLTYILNVVAASPDGTLQPVFGIQMETELTEREIDTLQGYRDHQPVRAGNLAYVQTQNDVYGTVILACAQAFFDERHRSAGRREPVPCPGTGRRGGGAALRQGGCGAMGAARAPSASIPFRPSCAGRPATAWRVIARRLELENRACAVARRAPRRSGNASSARPGTRRSRAMSAPSAAARSTRRCCSCTRFRSASAWNRASSAPWRRSSANCAAAIMCSAMSKPTISARRRTRSTSARSGTSTRSRRRPAGRGAAALREHARLPQLHGPAVGRPRSEDGGALGQLSADLQHGRADHFGAEALPALGGRVLARISHRGHGLRRADHDTGEKCGLASGPGLHALSHGVGEWLQWKERPRAQVSMYG